MCISEKMVCCHLLQALELRNFFTIVKQNTFGKLWRFIQEKEMVYKALYNQIMLLVFTFRSEGSEFFVSVNCSDVDCKRLALDRKVLKLRDCM